MKKLLVVLTVCMSLVVNAQDKVGKLKMAPDERANKVTEVLNSAVGGLSDEQKSKILMLNSERFTKLTAFRNANKGKKDEIKAEAKKLRSLFQTDLKSILNGEQKAKLKEYVKAKRAEGGKAKGKMKKGIKADDSIDLDDLDME